MIKKATLEELSEAVRLANLLWQDSEYDELKSELEAEILSDESIIALYYEVDKAVGFAYSALRHDYVEGTNTSPVGYLEGIFTLEDYRGTGIAAELLSYCEKWAKEKGCAEFCSDCELDNSASYAFHMKSGFEEANRIICFYKKLR